MFSPVMIRRSLMLSLVATCAAASSFAKDPHPGDVNAALRAHDQMRQSHAQVGSFTGGYRPLSAYTYSQAASLHAQALNSYSGVEQLPAETAQEHLKEISRNLEASSKELKKLDAATAQNAPDVHQLAQTIQEHYTAAQKSAQMAQQEITQTGKASITGNPNYSTMTHHLNAAASAHRQMLKTLGIEAH